jgi:hypothetical protein
MYTDGLQENITLKPGVVVVVVVATVMVIAVVHEL